MMPASTRGIGMALGFPDVCNTPTPGGPVPIPYPNITDHSMASGTVTNVRINMLDALNTMSQVPMSSGDEAGSAHSTIKGAQKYTMGMPNVRLNMMPAITLASLTSHNQMNCPIGAVLVPSAVNVRFNRAIAPGSRAPAGRMSARDAADYARAATSSGLVRTGDRITVTAIPLAFAAELAEAVHAALAEGRERVTIDLTRCPGGVLASAIDAAGLFLPAGTPLVSIVDDDGDERIERARGGPFTEVPLCLEVGPSTASAAEVLAGALIWTGRAELRGTATAGKGAITELVPLGDGSFAAVDRGATRAPDGTPIAARGIVCEAE